MVTERSPERVEGRKSGVWMESAQRVLAERYLMKDEEGRLLEDADGMCWRVAWTLAQAEARYPATVGQARTVEEVAHAFYDLMVEQKFLPNSPTLMNAGVPGGLQLSACFVLPVGDSIAEIFDAVKNAAIIHKSGGGTGFSFSRLRPELSQVATTQGVASGPVSFMRVFDAATEQIKQGGRRRGANMGILRVDHPDILQFIDCKLQGGIGNFNISVAITDRYMEALEQGEEYDLVAPHTGQAVGRLPAREVFDRIVQAAWRTGDPGLVFIDRINRSPANPTPELGQIEATNPCGEQPLLPNEACNLGSLNLAAFVKQGLGPEVQASERLDWREMERAIRLSARFLDDVIEVNPYPLPEIDAAVKGNRRIGLGVMGWADLLCLLGIPYDSEEALGLAHEVMAFINRIGHESSAELAEERGPFPNWSHSIYKDGRPLRNSTVTTIAPTGTISIIAGCSSGVEPHFAIAFSHIVGERHLVFVNTQFEQVAKELGFWSPELMEEVARRGTVQGLAQVPPDVQRVFVAAHDIAPEWHVRMQAAFQAHTDNGVSKTINLPHSATVEDVAQAYRLAWEVGCLGITVFRNGSKGEQVLHMGTEPLRQSSPQEAAPSIEEEVALRQALREPQGEAQDVAIKPRPRHMHGATYRAETPVGTAFVTVNRNGDEEPFEVFLNVGKAGSDTNALAEALARLISLCLRLPSGMSPSARVRQIIDQLSDIGGGRTLGFGPRRVRSLPDAVAQVLADDLDQTEKPALSVVEGGRVEALRQAQDEGSRLVEAAAEGPPSAERPDRFTADLCPECGDATLIYEEGCRKCYGCGYSEC